jgi:hypothetical protein
MSSTDDYYIYNKIKNERKIKQVFYPYGNKFLEKILEIWNSRCIIFKNENKNYTKI